MENKNPMQSVIEFLLDVFTEKQAFGNRTIKKGTTITSAIAAVILVAGFSTGFISEKSMKCMYDATQEIETEVRKDDA